MVEHRQGLVEQGLEGRNGGAAGLVLGRAGTLAEVAPLAVFDAVELRAVRTLLADRLPRVRSARD